VTGEEDVDPLRAAVEAQAAALVDDDVACFASYGLPEALAQMYRSPVKGALRSYEVLSVEVADGRGHSEVRFRGSPDVVLRTSWVYTTEGWRAATLEVRDEPAGEGLLDRLFGFGRRRKPDLPQREDLS
jgi:hypothetical protein